MRELLSSPIWQFVGVILALLATILSVAIYYKQRQFKSLSFAIISLTPLLDVRGEIKGKVKILYDDQPVQEVHLAIIELFNSGNLPIVSNDYEYPVLFSFGENTIVLSSEIISTIPQSLPAKIIHQDGKIEVDPTLLNVGDAITIKALVSGFEGQITVGGRIQGVKEISKSTSTKTRTTFRRDMKINFNITIFFILVGTAITLFTQDKYWDIGVLVIGAGLTALIIFTIMDFIKFKSRRG